MSTDGCVVVVGGTMGIGKELARFYAGTGRETVLSGREASRAEAVAAEIGGTRARHRPRPRQAEDDPRRPVVGRSGALPRHRRDPARRQYDP